MGYVRHRSLLPVGQPLSVEAVVRSAGVNDAPPFSWESLSASATLVITPCGAPIRTIVTGRRVITTGVYASRKAGRPMPYESMNELAFFMHCEVDTEVVDYRAQPFRLEFVIEGRKRTYILDCVRLMADGGIEVIEVKSDPRALQDPDYAEKLQAVRTICDQVGWRFRLVFMKAMMERAAFHRNVTDVQSRRMTDYTSADAFRVVEAVGRSGDAALGELAQHLGARALGFAKLKAMMGPDSADWRYESRRSRSGVKNDVTDTLKGMLDVGIVPMAFLGTEEAMPMFVRNLQLNGRMLPPCDFHPLSARRPEDQRLFATFVAKLEQIVVERGVLPKLSTLAADDLLPGVFEVSGGVIGRVCRLFEAALVHALRRGADKLERIDIYWATEHWAMEQAFIDRNPFARKPHG